MAIVGARWTGFVGEISMCLVMASSFFGTWTQNICQEQRQMRILLGLFNWFCSPVSRTLGIDFLEMPLHDLSEQVEIMI